MSVATQTSARPSIERAAGLGLLVSLASVVAAAVRSKAAALFLGPVGVGIVAEVQQLATLVLVPLAAFAGPALVQALANRDSPTHERVIGAALAWTLALGVLLSAAAVLLAPRLLPTNWNIALRTSVALVSSGTLFVALTNVATQTLVFRARLADSARLQVVATIVSALAVVVSTWSFGIVGQFVALVAAPAVMVPLYWRTARESGAWPRALSSWNLSPDFFRLAFTVGGASLAAGVALQGALYVTRLRLELTGGAALNGQFQAAWAIGSLYLGLVLSGIGNFAFPRFATADGTEQLQSEVNATAAFVAKFAPPAVLLVVAFSGLGVRLLYSSGFEPAVEILKWQLAGDVAKCFAWAYAGPLLYRGRVRAFMFAEFTVAVFLAGLSWILVPRFGAVGAGQAYLASHVVYLVAATIAARVSLGLRPKVQHIVIAVACTAVLAGIAALPTNIFIQGGLTVASLIWLIASGALPEIAKKVRARFLPAQRNSK